VAVPFVLGYLACIAFGYSNALALLVGTGLVATSVGVNAEILSELRMLRTKIGALVMGTSLADDVIGIIMLSVVISFITSHTIPVVDVLVTLSLTALLFVVCLVVGAKYLSRLSQRFRLGRYDLLLVGILFALALGVIADAIGLAMIVGGFLAGLVLGQTRYSPRLIQQSTLIGEGFFVPIFFVTTGMAFQPEAILGAGGFAIVLVAVAILGKLVGCFGGARVAGFSRAESTVVGVAMVPRAGVELVLIKLGVDAGVFANNPEVVSSLLLMVIVTTMITPPALSMTLSKLGFAGSRRSRGEDSGVRTR
jgi:Kef-type K+ transport system membrane component KefB